MVLNDSRAWPAPFLAERALVEAIKAEQMWRSLYETGAFESMEFRSLGNVDVESLSESEKEFCVRLGKEMVHIPAGDFMMGALEDDEDADHWEKPRHKVKLTRDFLMGKYAVTQALWQSVMGSNPSRFKGANLPVEQVSWFDCVAFCNKLSEQEGLTPSYAINGQIILRLDANGYRFQPRQNGSILLVVENTTNMQEVITLMRSLGMMATVEVRHIRLVRRNQWFWTLRHEEMLMSGMGAGGYRWR